MYKRILSLFLAVFSLVMLVGCNDENKKRVIPFYYYDLKDTTNYWVGTIEDLQKKDVHGRNSYSDESFWIEFKTTSVYPQLEPKDFDFENIEYVNYYYVTPPPESSVYWNYNTMFRQSAGIDLKEAGYEKLLEAINYIQSLWFVRGVELSHLVHPN